MIIGQSRGYSMMGWATVAIWFSASLISQLLYIRTHGSPYAAENLLSALGPWSWVLVTLELGIWMMVGILVAQRFSDKRAQMTFPME